MTDRLAELTGGTQRSLVASDSGPYSGDCEDPENDIDEDSREALQAFQREADAINTAIDKIRNNVHELEARYVESVKASTTPDVRLAGEREIQRMLNDNEKRSDAIRKRLKRIAGENKMFRGEFPHKTGELRVRVNAHQAMTKRFMTAMQLLETIQERHQKTVKGALEEKLRAINPNATDEEIASAVRNGEDISVVEHSRTMQQLPPEEQQRLRNGLEDLKSRNNEMKKLEASIIQLHQLFMDMQALVEAQGELLNNIEYNVEETKGATEAAHEELVLARNHQKSANKKKCILAMIIIAILAAIIVPVGIIYIPKWFPKSKVTELIGQLPGASPSPASSTNVTQPAAPAPAAQARVSSARFRTLSKTQ
jgi:syntaxin 1B/2/3